MRPAPASTRPTFGDTDPSSLRTSIVAGSAILFVAFGVIGKLLCVMFGLKGWIQVPIIVGFGASATFVAIRFGLGVANVAGQVVGRFVAPSGSSTPYQYGYSYQQALAARGDVAGALESYEAVLQDAPADLEAHVQAAELYLTSGNTTRALELFRALRTIPGVSQARDIYASNRLVDLYLLRGDEGRALVELRRLVERYPGTDTALRAREALGRLKTSVGHSSPQT
jgi:hypothetical protein